MGALRKTLKECSPRSAILGRCFVGGSIREVVTEARRRNSPTATIKIMGIVEERGFDISETKKRRQIAEDNVNA